MTLSPPDTIKPDWQDQLAADALWRARRACTQVSPKIVAGLSGVEGAYRVQRLNINRRVGEGARVTGRKIGLTSLAVQKQLGVSEPDYGFLLDTMDMTDARAVSMHHLVQPRIEAEIAFVLSRDLPADITPEGAPAYIDHALIAAEIVDSAITDWRIGIVETVADNASAGFYVLGQEKLSLNAFDPAAVVMRMTRNGEPASRGRGVDCLGGPLNALAWLARASAERGVSPRAGDVILTGALGPMVPAAAGDRFRIDVDGRTLDVRFSKDDA